MKHPLSLFFVLCFIALTSPLSAQIFIDSTGSNGFGDLPHPLAKSRFSNADHEYNLFVRTTGVDSVRGVGVYNYLSGGLAEKYGLWNHIEQAAGATGLTYGVRNYVTHEGAGDAYGLYSNLTVGQGSEGRLFGNYSLVDDQNTTRPNKLYANFYAETVHRRRANAYGNYILVRSYAQDASKTSYGQYIDVRGGGAAQRYGLYSSINGGAGYAGYFVGDVHINGTLTQASDEKLKTNVRKISGALELVNALEPKTYNYVASEEMGFADGDVTHYGFVAQEVAEVLPDLVTDVHHPYQSEAAEIAHAEAADELGLPTVEAGEEKSAGSGQDAADIRGVRYMDMIALLVGAVQDQDAEITARTEEVEELRGQLSELTERLNAISRRLEQTEDCVPCATATVPSSATGLELYPNPASEEFTVAWTVETPAGVRVEVYDAGGRLMRKANVDAAQRYTVETGAWPGGTYHVRLLERETERNLGTQSVVITR